MQATTTLPTERRQHERALYGGLIRFEYRGGIMTATVAEISETGMRLETPWEPPLGSTIRIQLPLPDRRGKVAHCVLAGQVARQDDGEIGVVFTEMLPRHMLQLRDFVWRSAPFHGV